MDALIQNRMNSTLKSLVECVVEDVNVSHDIRLKRMDTIMNLYKVIKNYDELEPLLKQFFAEKSQKEKFERRDYDQER